MRASSSDSRGRSYVLLIDVSNVGYIVRTDQD